MAMIEGVRARARVRVRVRDMFIFPAHMHVSGVITQSVSAVNYKTTTGTRFPSKSLSFLLSAHVINFPITLIQ